MRMKTLELQLGGLPQVVEGGVDVGTERGCDAYADICVGKIRCLLQDMFEGYERVLRLPDATLVQFKLLIADIKLSCRAAWDSPVNSRASMSCGDCACSLSLRPGNLHTKDT
jgi:hypothetical protein